MSEYHIYSTDMHNTKLAISLKVQNISFEGKNRKGLGVKYIQMWSRQEEARLILRHDVPSLHYL